MLNRKLTIGILAGINVLVSGYIAVEYGLASINNWLLIMSLALLSLAAYQILGLVEGYSDERRESGDPGQK